MVSGAYQHLRDWLSDPKLRLDFGGNEAASIVEVRAVVDKITRSSLFVRIRVRNVGRRVAKGCLVYLAGIEEVNESGTCPTTFQDAMPLSWPLKDFEPRHLPPSVDVYVDLVIISKDDPGWSFGVKQLYASQELMKIFKGTYRFHLVVTAENAKARKASVEITYKQDWNTLRAQTKSGVSLKPPS